MKEQLIFYFIDKESQIGKKLKPYDSRDCQAPERASTLNDSFKFFIEHALILRYKEYYRLLIIHKNELLADRKYKTLKGAKIAFLKFFGQRAWKINLKPEWCDFYTPGE